MESVCDDPEVIAANILVRTTFSRLSWQYLLWVLGARSPAAIAYRNVRTCLALTFHLGTKQLRFAGL